MLAHLDNLVKHCDETEHYNYPLWLLLKVVYLTITTTADHRKSLEPAHDERRP